MISQRSLTVVVGIVLVGAVGFLWSTGAVMLKPKAEQSEASSAADNLTQTPVQLRHFSEPAPALDDQQPVALDLTAYENLLPQELLTQVAKQSVQADGIPVAKLLLALLDAGIIRVNASLKEGPQNGAMPYSPLFAALVLDRSISAEQIQAFFDHGSFAFTNQIWISAAGNLADPEALDVLLEQGGFGPEHYQLLFERAMLSGNQQVYQHLLGQGRGQLNDAITNTLYERVDISVTNALNTWPEKYNDAALLPRMRTSMLQSLTRYLFQLDTLVASGYLSPEKTRFLTQQRQHLVALYEEIEALD
ncbi:hypothetical protein CWI80_02010 [Pseudidiomarina sediminum]|uniref:Uncharacterized protein n=1 Tax=Pseudidiomarina sediminum TaxID=431675 RepID=A0A432Z8D4_9GAMM|nr:hypothetical protein [Pseudidiomarina sediminum]RUO74153.1 hypothetical protein CWI80_02010 [Pseudidiomarina sediminum]